MFRKFLMASTGAFALVGPALAVDLPVQPPIYAPPPFSWTGLYLGGQIGYAWGNDRANVTAFVPGTPATPGTGVPPCAICEIPEVPGTPPIFLSDPFSTSPQGVIGGAHIGYNLQINQWVIGLEGTVDGTSISKTAALGFPVDIASLTDSARATVQGSIRARAGIAFDRVLLYATGGAAFTGIQNTYSLAVSMPFFLNESISKTRAGWTVGGGIEYAITNNWSVRAEYRYSDLGHYIDYPFTTVVVPAGDTLSVQHHLTENQVQVGFSYKFDTWTPSSVVAKY
jgi:outer membrane immunogenic protein